jgi:hypothetical protein
MRLERSPRHWIDEAREMLIVAHPDDENGAFCLRHGGQRGGSPQQEQRFRALGCLGGGELSTAATRRP